MIDYDRRMRLIGRFYQLAVDPLAFDDLLAEWDEAILDAMKGGAFEAGDPRLLEHAERADAIILKLHGEEKPAPAPLARVIAEDPNPAALVSARGIVLAANPAAARFGIRAGDRLPDELGAFSTASTRIAALLGENGRTDEGGVLGLMEFESEEGPDKALFGLSRVISDPDPSVAGLLTALAPLWNPQSLAMLARHYGLTAAETDIVRLLVEGRSAGEIAAARDTSRLTVRTQVKSILQKTGIESQSDLVRRLGFLQGMERAAMLSPVPGSPAPEGAGEERRIRLEGGRTLAYRDLGPASGRPVLFIHGLIDSPTFTAGFRAQLAKRQIRLIGPERPSFGASDPYRDRANALEEFSSALGAMLDHLGIGRIDVLGHMAGTLYAIAAARHLPGRINSILSVSGAVPMVGRWQFTTMSKGHRIAGLTARYAPSALPLLVNAGIRLLRNNRSDRLIDLFFHDSPHDRALASDPEIEDLFRQRFEFVTRQGATAFLTDVELVSSDWSHLAEGLECPLTLLHGEDDRIVLLDGVKRFAATRSGTALHVVPDCGQLVLFREIDRVFDLLESPMK